PVTTLSTVRTQGLKSLRVNAKGYVPYVSHTMATLGAVGQTITYDLMLPTQQANPGWYGASQLYILIPSNNVFNYYAGEVELTGLPLNAWTPVSFMISADMAQTLGTSYGDLSLTI